MLKLVRESWWGIECSHNLQVSPSKLQVNYKEKRSEINGGDTISNHVIKPTLSMLGQVAIMGS